MSNSELMGHEIVPVLHQLIWAARRAALLVRHAAATNAAILTPGLGMSCAVTAVGALSGPDHVSLLIGSFGGSCLLVFGSPQAIVAQPRNVLGGHVLTAIIGLMCLGVFGSACWTTGLAVGLAFVAMQVTRTLHPPAAANPIIVMLTQPNGGFVVTPILTGAIVIVLTGLAFNNLVARSRYPVAQS